MSVRYFHFDNKEDIYVSSKIMSKVAMRYFHFDDEEDVYVSSRIMEDVKYP